MLPQSPSASSIASRASHEYFLEKSDEQDIRNNTRRNKASRWRYLQITATILAVSLALLEAVALIIVVRNLKVSNSPPLLGELNHLVPEFQRSKVLFRKDPTATYDHKTEESRNATRENWLSYMPKGNGFIAINKSSDYILPEPIISHNQDTYSIAVFHQLHCLYAIMDVYDSLSLAVSHSGHSHQHERSEAGRMHNEHDHRHVDHCFRYLRQSLVCCGDTSLEGQDPNSDAMATDGTGAVHVCKDFEAIRLWAEEKRVVNQKHS